METNETSATSAANAQTEVAMPPPGPDYKQLYVAAMTMLDTLSGHWEQEKSRLGDDVQMLVARVNEAVETQVSWMVRAETYLKQRNALLRHAHRQGLSLEELNAQVDAIKMPPRRKFWVEEGDTQPRGPYVDGKFEKTPAPQWKATWGEPTIAVASGPETSP